MCRRSTSTCPRPLTGYFWVYPTANRDMDGSNESAIVISGEIAGTNGAAKGPLTLVGSVRTPATRTRMTVTVPR